jgi:alpha-glucosidase
MSHPTTSIYQIYPRSFADSNGDGIGDLRGIIERLDYIASLGVNTIWLSPMFISPQQDFGYDIADYYHVNPEYGTDEEMRELIRTAHGKGLKVVLDLVMNHTSAEHPWFIASARKEEPYTNWYIWRKGKNKKPPTNWKSMIGGNGWQYHPGRGEWYYASFLPFQPDLNYHNPAVKQAMFDVARHWLREGADGFRLDIFNVIIKDPEFRDNPFSWRPIPSETDPDGFFQHMQYTVNHPGNFELAKELRSACRAVNPGAILLGEVFGDTATLRQYLGEGDGLNYVFLFEMLPFKLRASFFRDKIIKFEQLFPAPMEPTYVFGNHDRIRPINRVNGNVQKWKLLALFQLTARGLPVIYMGEEIGMEQLRIPLKQAKDPLAIKYNWIPEWIRGLVSEDLNRDGCRTPMQWSAEQHAGFTKGKTPWLPVHGNYSTRNVQVQEGNPDSLLSWYKRLLTLRKEHVQLREGRIELLTTSADNAILAYSRITDSGAVRIYINFSGKGVELPLDTTFNILAATKGVQVSGKIQLPPWSGCLLLEK